ncbi:MAG: RdgB/HAM1 family non-canonical purine NTP pyrophosphatase [Terriglobales bacterium]|jgi:XTP/dITP diphosphohydrolase
MNPIYIATSNAGKLRDFAAAAKLEGVQVEPLPGFKDLPEVEEDGNTFAANARKKAEHYSALFPGKLVLADDSGLEVNALGGAPGVHSARYAATSSTTGNADDSANNQKLLSELQKIGMLSSGARFVAVITAALDGKTVAEFMSEVRGSITDAPRGSNGFGYDPLFVVEGTGTTMAELSPAEKAARSHRGRAFRRFLEWYRGEGSRFAKL